MAETLEIFGKEYTNVAGIKATDNNGDTKTFIIPNLVSKTVSPTDFVQIITPNFTEEAVISGMEIVINTNQQDTPVTVSVSLPIVSGNNYIVTGSGTVYSSYSGGSNPFVISGSWECGTALPITEDITSSGYAYINKIILSPTELTAYRGYVGATRVDVSLTELRISSPDGTTYDGLSSVTVNAAPLSEPNIETLTKTLWDTPSSISFTLKDEPKAFFLQRTSTGSTGTVITITSADYDGQNLTVMGARYYNSAVQHMDFSNEASFSYSGNTLTISVSSTSHKFIGEFKLTYIY